MITEQRVPLPHGIDLQCRVAGKPGRPLMVFLHGFPEAAFVWDEMLSHFSQTEQGGFFCVAPHMRGYGDSSAPPEVSAYRAKHLVQDIAALAQSFSAEPCVLVAHDWGGAVAWNLANQLPSLLKGLVIVNSPHPGTFLRELQSSPEQQSSSAYMNFLIRPDAEHLLAEDDYRRLWAFFTNMGAADGPHAWLTEAVKQQYRQVWGKGLTGALNYYRASPLRPPRDGDAAANAIQLPLEMLQVHVPTLVIWGMQDIALPPGLIDGLDAYVPDLTLHRIEEGTHWLVHEQPTRVAQLMQDWLARKPMARPPAGS
jgi:pimeloyl-ACP methyl ester carboxylesterase